MDYKNSSKFFLTFLDKTNYNNFSDQNQGGNRDNTNNTGVDSSFKDRGYNRGYDSVRNNQYGRTYQNQTFSNNDQTNEMKAYNQGQSQVYKHGQTQGYNQSNNQAFNSYQAKGGQEIYGDQSLWNFRYNRSGMNWKYIWEENESLFQEHLEHGKKKKKYLENSKLNVYFKGGQIDSVNEFKDFSEMPFHEKLQKNLTKMGFQQMTPIQRFVMPYLVEGKDAMGCAQTGSGKTVSFLGPIIDKMLKDGPPASDKSLPYGVSAPIALILTPTRELAEQIYKECRKLVHKTGILVVKVYGGVPIESQMKYITNGCDILVATPGRLIDFIKRNLVTLNSVKFLVFDEADRMLDMGFEDQLKDIIFSSDIPSKEQRINMMFSATFDSHIREIARSFMNDFYFISKSLDQENNANENIEQLFIYAEDKDKVLKLHETLQTLKGSVIIFLETKRAVDNLNYFLNQRNYNTIAIHGDKTQDRRQAAITSFSKGEIPILIATDVASRGLDFPNIPYVINYDLPNNIDDYIHRIGRTGRCGNKGTAISFISESCRISRDLHKLLIKSNQVIPEWFEGLIRKCDSYTGGSNNFGYKKKNNYGGNNYSAGGFTSRQNNYTNSNYVSVPPNFFKKGENFIRDDQVNNVNNTYASSQTQNNQTGHSTYNTSSYNKFNNPNVNNYSSSYNQTAKNYPSSDVKFTRGIYYNNPYPHPQQD